MLGVCRSVQNLARRLARAPEARQKAGNVAESSPGQDKMLRKPSSMMLAGKDWKATAFSDSKLDKLKINIQKADRNEVGG